MAAACAAHAQQQAAMRLQQPCSTRAAAAAVAAAARRPSWLRLLQARRRMASAMHARRSAGSGASPADSRSGGSAPASAASSPAAGSDGEPKQQEKPPNPPESEAEAAGLLSTLGLQGSASPAALLASMQQLSGDRQCGVMRHVASVVQHLRGPAVGLSPQQAGRLLERCPVLFSWAPQDRAARLFSQLQGAGLAADAAVRCLASFPPAAATRSFEDGLDELAALLALSRDWEGGRTPKVPAAQRTAAALLADKPSAIRLVATSPGYLTQHSLQLQQEGFLPADVAALAWCQPELLATNAVWLLQRASAVLGQELGLAPADVVGLVASRKPGWLTSSADTLRSRAAALAEAFGRQAAADIVLSSHSALKCAPEVWRRNQRILAACGVADPRAALAAAPLLLHLDHAAPALLRRRLLLQRGFGLAPAQLYGEQAYALLYGEPAELARRLQFVRDRGQAHRLAAKAPRRTSLPPERRPLGLRSLQRLALPAFVAAVGATQAEWDSWAAANPPEACALYRDAQQAAEDEAARLAAALPPELRDWQPQPFKGVQRRPAAAASG